MPKTEIIIFSKNRPLQLKSLLISIIENSDIEANQINIIYKVEHGISYDRLIEQYDCNFILQSNFLIQVYDLIRCSESDYIFFMVDDLIFRDKFSLKEVEFFLENNQDVEAFSFRLGRNIEDGLKPNFCQPDGGKFLTWETAKGLGNTWNYFWEVSSSIYRKELVLNYLEKCNPNYINFPNPLEQYYYDCMPHYRGNSLKRFIKFSFLIFPLQFKSNRFNIKNYITSILFYFRNRRSKMACFEKSKCFTQGINMVAERKIGYQVTYDIFYLNDKFKQGFIIDHKSLKNINNKHPNEGNKYVKLVKYE